MSEEGRKLSKSSYGIQHIPHRVSRRSLLLGRSAKHERRSHSLIVKYITIVTEPQYQVNWDTGGSRLVSTNSHFSLFATRTLPIRRQNVEQFMPDRVDANSCRLSWESKLPEQLCQEMLAVLQRFNNASDPGPWVHLTCQFSSRSSDFVIAVVTRNFLPRQMRTMPVAIHIMINE
jgi:hypothetical protein